MKKLNERLALVLFSAAAIPFAAIQAFHSGAPLAIGLSALSIMLLSCVSVLAAFEVMQQW